MPDAYHSAHLPIKGAPPALSGWSNEHGTAFVHDLMSSDALPAAYAAADVIYTEPPWKQGFDVFNERAGVADGRTYEQFMRHIDALLSGSKIPVMVVTGKIGAKFMPNAERQRGIWLSGPSLDARLVSYGPSVVKVAPTSADLLRTIALEFHCGGDFCAGYGRTVKAFVSRGQRFVASDYSAEAIGYIAANVREW